MVKNKRFQILTKKISSKKLVAALMVVAFAILGVQQVSTHFSNAAGWTFTSVRGDYITYQNNPGGYVNYSRSTSPDDGINFSPAFGSGGGGVYLVGTGFPSLADSQPIHAQSIAMFANDSGVTSACYLTTSGEPYCWGNSRHLGNNSSTGSTLSPVPVVRGEMMSGEYAIQIASTGFGYEGSYCILTQIGNIYCWGTHTMLLGGSAQTAPTRLTLGILGNTTIKQIMLSNNRACVITINDAPYCWDSGNTIPTKVKTVSDGSQYVMPDKVKSLSSNNGTTCAIAWDNMIYCWGRNSDGQVGDNTTVDKNDPTILYLDTIPVDGRIFTQVEVFGAGSSSFGCALNSVGDIYCWGNHATESFASSSIPVRRQATDINIKFGKLSQDNSNNNYAYSFCAISVSGNPYCGGDYDSSYLGDGTNSASSSKLIKVKTASDGGVMPDQATYMTVGTHRKCVVAVDEAVYCWGANDMNGLLGSGTRNNDGAKEPQTVKLIEPLPTVAFDDSYGAKCDYIELETATHMFCPSTTTQLAEGLHDVLVKIGDETQTLAQSYMVRRTPSAPSGVAVVPKNKSVSLSWQTSEEKPYIASVNYCVEFKKTSDSVWMEYRQNNAIGVNYGCHIQNTNKTSANIAFLENGTQYDFRVRAIYSSTWSGYSSIVTATPQASSYVPSQVENLIYERQSNSTIKFDWGAPLFDGGSAINDYDIKITGPVNAGADYINLDYTPGLTSSVGYSTSASFVDKTYTVQIVAINANGASEPKTIEVYIPQNPTSPQSATSPGVPTSTKINNVNTNQVMLSWAAPSTGGSPITQYEVRYSQNPSFSDWVDNTTNTCISSTPAPPTTSCVVTGLTLGDHYYFQVRAVNAIGASGWGVIHGAIVGAPERPIINTVTAGDSTIYVAWNMPNDNGAPIYNYVLCYSTDPAFASLDVQDCSLGTQINIGTTTNYTLNSATNGTIYYFRVLAHNSRGDSAWSDPAAAIPYAPPSIISVSPDHGLTLGNELITITGDNFNGTTSVTIGGEECLTFVVIDVNTINCLTPPGQVGAADVTVTNLGGSDTKVGGYTYGLPSIALVIDNDISFTITNPGTGTVSTSHTANVKTDNPLGFTLSISMAADDQRLMGGSAFLNSTDASYTPMALPSNTWGCSLQDANNHWTSVPVASSPKQIKKTTTKTINGMSGTGENTTVYYGVNVDMTQLAGQYTGSVLYTAVTNI